MGPFYGRPSIWVINLELPKHLRSLFLYVTSSCWVNAVEELKRCLSLRELSVTEKYLVLEATEIHSFLRYREILSVLKWKLQRKVANLASEYCIQADPSGRAV
jgi:putative hemolysin